MLGALMIKPRAHRRILFKAVLVVVLALLPQKAFALAVGEVAKDLACPCECPLILADCNMTCGLNWKAEIGEMIKAGKTKPEIMDFFIATYGEEARLTTFQKIDGKVFQYTRGFSTIDWAVLWAGVGLWALALMVGIYFGVRKYSGRTHV